MSADNNLMRLVAVSPVHIGDHDAQMIHRIFRQFVAQEQAAGTKSRVMGENVRLDDQGEITLLFGQTYNDPRDLAQAVLDVIHKQPRDYSDTLVADEMKAKIRPDGGYTFLDDTQLFPQDQRPKTQLGSLGNPQGIATSVSQAYGSQFAAGLPMSDSYQQTSTPDIASVARKGQSMYQTQTQTPSSSQSAASADADAASQTVPVTDQSQAAASSSTAQTPVQSEDDKLLDEIMPDADSIINTALNPSLDVTATTQNEIMMKSQFEANLNNIYVNSMDDLSKLQLHRDQLVSELSQFKHQIMATSPKSLEQYSNVKRLVDQARQQRQEERQKVANAYDENLQKLLDAKIEKFKKMYRQQYPDDTDEKLAEFDRAYKPIEDQYDQQLKHAKELARQGLINQFMIEHQSDPVLRSAFRFMAAKNNMESQYLANQAALEKMQPQQPAGYQPVGYQPQQSMSPADRLTQAQAAQPQQSSAQPLTPTNDPFAASSDSSRSPQAAQSAAQAALQQPAVTEQVPDLPDDDDQDADFDVLDAVNHDADQALAADSSATPVGHVPDSDPDFADNSGEAVDFTDPDDAVKQQAAELDHDSSDHLQSDDADAVLPDDHQKKQTVDDDPDFPDDDDDAIIDSLANDPFDEVDDEPVQKSSKKSHGKSDKKRARRNKSKRHSGSKFKKVALGGAVIGLLSLGGIAGAAHLGLFNGGSGSTNSKSELASSSSQQSKKAPKGTIKVGSVLDVTVNGKQIRVKIVQVRSDGSAIGEATDGSRYAISAAQAKQAANAISHADKDANH